jgi:hypothetical protein
MQADPGQTVLLQLACNWSASGALWRSNFFGLFASRGLGSPRLQRFVSQTSSFEVESRLFADKMQSSCKVATPLPLFAAFSLFLFEVSVLFFFVLLCFATPWENLG